MLLLSKGSLDELPSVYVEKKLPAQLLGHSNMAFVSMSSLKIDMKPTTYFALPKQEYTKEKGYTSLDTQ